MTFTFFDLVSAIRERRTLKFRTASEERLAVPVTLHNSSRDSRTWEVTVSDGTSYLWPENNSEVTIISEV